MDFLFEAGFGQQPQFPGFGGAGMENFLLHNLTLLP